MSYAIMRWTKVTSQAQADKATGHNYRTDRVANADREAPHPNVELVNTAGRGYWELATERIDEVVTRKVRDDQVRCMEVILTASPEFFVRDANQRAVDMSQSQWFKDQLTFLEKTFGKENVLSCTLHQDEKSPHVHAVIAPITDDGHLSAKRLFTPKTMTGYQTQYAEAMKVHGLERGVEHSQAEHQPMKRMYGQQGQTAAELKAQLEPASSYQDVQVKPPSGFELLNLDKWATKTSAQVNDQARAQVEAANQRAEKASNLALENAAAKDQVRVLQKQLNTSEGLKEGHKAQSEEAAKRIAGGEAPAEIVSRGNDLLDQDRDRLRVVRQTLAQLLGPAEKAGDYARVAKLLYGPGKEPAAEKKKLEADLGRFAGGRSRLKDLDEEPAKLAAEQAKAAQRREIIAQGDRERAQQAEALRVVKHELSLMDQAFSIYRWKVGPEELTACLIVSKEKVEQVQNALRIDGKSYAAHLGVQGEPHRTDGQQTVYVKYQTSFAHQIGAYLDRVREIGGQVYEHAGSQTRREQLQAQPQQKTQEREQGPAPAKGMEMGE
jgi:hypothetical protein